jgi:hypothetical protein
MAARGSESPLPPPPEEKFKMSENQQWLLFYKHF